jgi:hypothetical protein
VGEQWMVVSSYTWNAQSGSHTSPFNHLMRFLTYFHTFVQIPHFVSLLFAIAAGHFFLVTQHAYRSAHTDEHGRIV